MTQILLNRNSSAARTSQLVLMDSQQQLKGEVVVHPDVVNDQYVYVETFEINPAEGAVQRLVGSLVMTFKGVNSQRILYVYGQPDCFKAAAHSIGVPVGLFGQLISATRTARTALSMEFHTSFFRLGTKPVENRPMFQITENLGFYRKRVASMPSSRAPQQPRRVQAAPSYRTYGHYVYDDSTDVYDAMFMGMFPGIAPLYRPNSMLAWYLWFNSMNYMPGQYFYDPYALNDWTFVPGFPGAVSQIIVPYGDGYRVEIMDGSGVCMGNFALSGYGEQMQIITGDGDAFSVMNAGQPYIQYVEGDQAFCWNGIDTPFTGTPMEVQGAIMDAGPLYEPGPMLYMEPGLSDSGYQYAEPAYGNPGYVVDPGYAQGVDSPGYPEAADAAIYTDGSAQPEPYYEPAAPANWQDPGVPDASYEEPVVEQSAPVEYVETNDYSGGGADNAYVPDEGGSFGGSGGGDSWGD